LASYYRRRARPEKTGRAGAETAADARVFIDLTPHDAALPQGGYLSLAVGWLSVCCCAVLAATRLFAD
jgi:hypothetical protein